jgi:hypothetical protein
MHCRGALRRGCACEPRLCPSKQPTLSARNHLESELRAANTGGHSNRDSKAHNLSTLNDLA